MKQITFYKIFSLLMILFITGCVSPKPIKQPPISTSKSYQKLINILDLNYKNNLMDKLYFKTELKKIEFINMYFSTYPYYSDSQLYAQSEYWASPEEYMKNRGGDCEDIALNKYNELVKNGISPNKLDFVKGKTNNQLHIVLRYYDKTNNKYLILEHAYIMDYEEYTRAFFIETTHYGITKFKFLKRLSNFVHFFIG